VWRAMDWSTNTNLTSEVNTQVDAATEQIQRIVKRINNDIEAGRYCSAVFLDVSQTFDKFGIENYFIESKIDFQLISIIRSYLLHRTFRVKCGEVITQLNKINFRVLQDSVLGPVLYLLYIVDLPVALDRTAIYVDDTAVFIVHNYHIEASL